MLPRLYTNWRNGAHKDHVLEDHRERGVFCRQCDRFLTTEEADRWWPVEEKNADSK